MRYFSWNSKYYKHNATSIAYLKVKNLIEIQLSLHKLGLNIPYEKMIPEIGSLITKIDKLLAKKNISNKKRDLYEYIKYKVEEKISKLKENSELYALPPTIINFIYLTLILFNLIDKMILSVL